jgi:hypothetical protein
VSRNRTKVGMKDLVVVEMAGRWKIKGRISRYGENDGEGDTVGLSTRGGTEQGGFALQGGAVEYESPISSALTQQPVQTRIVSSYDRPYDFSRLCRA